jgi:putative SOS response-associated peptidase YedK
VCNDYRLEVDNASTAEDFSDLKIRIEFSEGVPNVGARADIKITDSWVIVALLPVAAGGSISRG